MSQSLYQQQGFLHLPGFYRPHELVDLEAVLLKHHQAWLLQHQASYQNGLINSHSLTADSALNEQDKSVLFQTIAAPALLAQLAPIFPHKLPCTQAMCCCFRQTCCIVVYMVKTAWRLTSFTAMTILIYSRIAATTPCPMPHNWPRCLRVCFDVHQCGFLRVSGLDNAIMARFIRQQYLRTL